MAIVVDIIYNKGSIYRILQSIRVKNRRGILMVPSFAGSHGC